MNGFEVSYSTVNAEFEHWKRRSGELLVMTVTQGEIEATCFLRSPDKLIETMECR